MPRPLDVSVQALDSGDPRSGDSATSDATLPDIDERAGDTATGDGLVGDGRPGDPSGAGDSRTGDDRLGDLSAEGDNRTGDDRLGDSGVSGDNPAGDSGGGDSGCCSISDLQDDFATNSIGTIWTMYKSGDWTASIEQGLLTCTSPSGEVGWVALQTATHWDFTGGELSVELVTGPRATSEIWPFIWIGYSSAPAGTHADSYEYVLYRGSLVARVWVDNSATDINTVTFDGNAHRFWQIREIGGQIEFRTSADGQQWSVLTTVAAGLNVTDVVVTLGAGTSLDEAEVETVSFDNVNIFP
ncbi:hypothetical protein ACFL6C_11420 [Myxococcota bacterium]